MADTLLAIVLATSSAKGGSIVCRWPPSPQSAPRLARPLPDTVSDPSQLDNPWRASHMHESDNAQSASARTEKDARGYLWQRPNVTRDRSASFSHSASHSASGRNSPSKRESPFDYDDDADGNPIQDDYDDLFGYSSEFLASMLCPQRPLCHQKFMLKVDDLCFVGHPVCAESGGTWRFKAERPRTDLRGRVTKKRHVSGEDPMTSADFEHAHSQSPSHPPQRSSWLQTFHVVFVHDHPDPSSSASGNIQKYFDIIYEQVAFTLTAVLFQEQVLSNFVELECDTLGALKDDFATRGEPFEAYMQQALVASSIAPAIKTLYESIKAKSLAHLTIHNIPLELQLPPYLDSLIHSEEEYDSSDFIYRGDDSASDSTPWGRDLSFAWRLPSLAPWKSLLLLDGPEGRDWTDVFASIRDSNVKDGDRMLAEQLVKFLEMADVTLSLVDMASLLDWDLDTQVFPIVRWLVHHRRAKVVDIVHRGLKTVFTLALKFEKPLRTLSADFREAFPDPSLPSLPQLLSLISQSTSDHFYGSIVKKKDLVPIYHGIVQWMLQRDLLVTLHLRIRVVATADLKRRVRKQWKSRRRVSWKDDTEDIFSTRGRRARPLQEDQTEKQMDDVDSLKRLHLSPQDTREQLRRDPGSGSQHSRSVEPPILEDGIELDEEIHEKIHETAGSGFPEESLEDGGDDHTSSIILDPARASFLERQWLQRMSEGKEDALARLFDQINRYFDGKCTDDEILFRAEISRKQLREVLHHYEEYLQTFLHPS